MSGDKVGREGLVRRDCVRKYEPPKTSDQPRGGKDYGKQAKQEMGTEVEQDAKDVQAKEELFEENKTAKATEATAKEHHSDADEERCLKQKSSKEDAESSRPTDKKEKK